MFRVKPLHLEQLKADTMEMRRNCQVNANVTRTAWEICKAAEITKKKRQPIQDYLSTSSAFYDIKNLQMTVL